MSAKNSRKIDKFVIYLILAMIIMAGLVIFTFRGLFSALTTAYEVETKPPESQTKVDKAALEEAYEYSYNRKIVPLKVR